MDGATLDGAGTDVCFFDRQVEDKEQNEVPHFTCICRIGLGDICSKIIDLIGSMT